MEDWTTQIGEGTIVEKWAELGLKRYMGGEPMSPKRGCKKVLGNRSIRGWRRLYGLD